MRWNTHDTDGLIGALDDLAVENGYEKIFAKIPATAWNAFKSADYIEEAVVPNFFAGKTDGFFISKYFSAGRQKAPNAEKLSALLKRTGGNSKNRDPETGAARGTVEPCKSSDAAEMSAIYRQVFESYPFPIQKPAYLKRMINEGVLYFCIRLKGRIAAMAAAEIDLAGKNVEMTDFATLAEWRGMGFAGLLLRHMERETRKRGIQTAYSIARAASYGMNSVFKKGGYRYSGLLKNNSNICGRIQSMAVWYRHL